MSNLKFQKFCAYCGTLNADNARSCENCGSRIFKGSTNEIVSDDNLYNVEISERKSSNKKLMISDQILGIFGLLIYIISIVTSLSYFDTIPLILSTIPIVLLIIYIVMALSRIWNKSRIASILLLLTTVVAISSTIALFLVQISYYKMFVTILTINNIIFFIAMIWSISILMDNKITIFFRSILFILLSFLVLSILYGLLGVALIRLVDLSLLWLCAILLFFGGSIVGFAKGLIFLFLGFSSMLIPNKMIGFVSVLIFCIINCIWAIYKFWTIDTTYSGTVIFGAIIFTLIMIHLTFTIIFGAFIFASDDL